MDWIQEMGTKKINIQQTGADDGKGFLDIGIISTIGIVSSINVFYNNINRDDVKDIQELEKDNEKLQQQLQRSKEALGRAKDKNDTLKKELDSYSVSKSESKSIPKRSGVDRKELDALKKENKTIEDNISKLTDQRKKQINEYLGSIEDPVDLHQLGRSFRGLTDEYKDAIKQFHEEKKGLINEINDVNDEYIELTKDNIRLKKRRLEMQNEIEALKNLIDNNNSLKDDILTVNDEFSQKVKGSVHGLSQQITGTDADLDKANKELLKLQQELDSNTEGIQKLNNDLHRLGSDNSQYRELNRALEQLEDVHEKRIDAGIDEAMAEEEVVDIHGLVTGKIYFSCNIK